MRMRGPDGHIATEVCGPLFHAQNAVGFGAGPGGRNATAIIRNRDGDATVVPDLDDDLAGLCCGHPKGREPIGQYAKQRARPYFLCLV